MKPFLIVGLPRTRTAWLSNYFTTDDVLCFHDLLLDHPIHNIRRILGKRNGNADSALCLYPDIVLEWEMSKEINLLIIDRSIEECLHSYQKAQQKENAPFDPDQAFKAAIFGYSEIKRWTTSPIIPYEQIDDRIHEIHMHLTPQVTFSPARANMLRPLNITQIMNSRIQWAAKELKAQQQFNLRQYGLSK